jgi:hypothetical protein
MLRWLLKEVWEKINFPQVYRDIKALGKKHGKRFFWAALIWEVIEDVVFPFISWLCGVPELIPVFLVLHFEPIVYPVFFWGFRMWDRAHGKEPWEPDRRAQSAYWRSVVKVLTFQLAVTGWLFQVITWKPLIVFAVLTGLFDFVHERIWHDTNFGIATDDTVQFKRILGKTGTYLLFSIMTLYPLLKVSGLSPIWKPLLVAQVIAGSMYLVLESVWSKSVWGVSPTPIHDVNESGSTQ